MTRARTQTLPSILPLFGGGLACLCCCLFQPLRYILTGFFCYLYQSRCTPHVVRVIEKGEGIASCSSSSCPPYAMDITFDIASHVIVHDIGHTFDVQATSAYVSGKHNLDFARMEL